MKHKGSIISRIFEGLAGPAAWNEEQQRAAERREAATTKAELRDAIAALKRPTQETAVQDDKDRAPEPTSEGGLPPT